MTKEKKSLYKKIFVFCVGIIIVIGVTISYIKRNKEININGHKIAIEIANTEKQRAVGLGGKNSLCEDCGMLFVFDKTDKYKFWMKDMKFDIDIIWIEKGVVIDVSENVSHKTPEAILTPKETIDSVLEIPAGSTKRLNITIGQKIEF